MDGVSSVSGVSEFKTSSGPVFVRLDERMESELRVLAGTIHNGRHGPDFLTFEDMFKMSLLSNAPGYGIEPSNILEYCRRLMRRPIDDPVQCVGVSGRKNVMVNKQVPAMFTDAAILEREPDRIKNYARYLAGRELDENKWRDVAKHLSENSRWYYGGGGVTFTYVSQSADTNELVSKAVADRPLKRRRKRYPMISKALRRQRVP